jgi:hypothetical protein
MCDTNTKTNLFVQFLFVRLSIIIHFVVVRSFPGTSNTILRGTRARLPSYQFIPGTRHQYRNLPATARLADLGLYSHTW